MKRVFVLPLVLVFALLAVIPASAAAPIVDTVSQVDDRVVFDHTLCPDIQVWDREVYTLRFTVFLDQQGNVRDILMHGTGVDNFYNPDNPNVVLSGHFVGNAVVDPATGNAVVASGAPYHITAPGYGTVLVRAGRWVGSYPDGQVAGKNSEIDPKDVAQFCSILAGN